MLTTCALAALAATGAQIDASEAGLHWGWLVFGFTAQGLFAGRMLVQWIASERAGHSLVPPLFWWLSLVGGMSMVVYFLRRGDPVGIFGQVFALLVYGRNLWMIYRRPASIAG